MKKINWYRLRVVFYVFTSPLLIMLLWNCIMPKFGMIEINYLEAFGLKLLCNLLFTKNFLITDDTKKISEHEEKSLFEDLEKEGLIKKEK